MKLSIYSIFWSAVLAPRATQAFLDFGGVMGDPHFLTWGNEWYDFHGICDLSLIHAPGFSTGLGLDIHIRTKPRYDYSYIEAAAIKIGDDVLEVGSFGQYFVNGVESADLYNVKFGGLYAVEYEVVDNTKSVFTIKTGEFEAIIVKTYKDMVNVHIKNPGSENFESAVGMMGDFEGHFVARDGVTIIEDHDAFGQEWQVREQDGELFQTPSTFDKCVPPSSIKQVRRLGEATVSEDAAALACAHFEDEQKRDMCIFDVMAMADLGVADVHGAY